MSKKQTEAHKNGSGYILLDFDEKTKAVNLDVSGNDGDFGSFRNDASILWTVAQSYMTSCKVLLKSIENGFENSDRYLVTNLIIPYYFNFRHYIEVSLKAITLWANKSEYKKIHGLSELFKDVKESIGAILTKPEMWNSNVKKDDVSERLEKVNEYLLDLEKNISIVEQNETSVEYYRFIFETNNQLEKAKISFDYKKEFELYNNTVRLINSIVNNLRVLIYIFAPTLK